MGGFPHRVHIEICGSRCPFGESMDQKHNLYEHFPCGEKPGVGLRYLLYGNCLGFRV